MALPELSVLLTPIDDILIGLQPQQTGLKERECQFMTQLCRHMRAGGFDEKRCWSLPGLHYVGDLLMCHRAVLPRIFKKMKASTLRQKLVYQTMITLLGADADIFEIVMDAPARRIFVEARRDVKPRLQEFWQNKWHVRVRCPVCQSWQWMVQMELVHAANNGLVPSHCTCGSSRSESVTLMSDSILLKSSVSRTW